MTWGIERSVVRKIGTRSIQISRLERIFVDIVLSEKLWMAVFSCFTKGNMQHGKPKNKCEGQTPNKSTFT